MYSSYCTLDPAPKHCVMQLDASIMFGSNEPPQLTLFSGSETREMPEVIQLGGAKQGELGVITYSQDVVTVAVSSQGEVEIDDDELVPPMFAVWRSETGELSSFQELEWGQAYELPHNVMITDSLYDELVTFIIKLHDHYPSEAEEAKAFAPYAARAA